MTIPDLSLKGKVVIVTGGKWGIGRAIALAFAEAGADVAVCSRGITELEAVAEEIRKLGRRSLAVQVDVTSKADVDDLVQKVEGELGGIDILVNNAGTFVIAPLIESREEDWDKVINVHVKGAYLCSQAVARRMIEQKRKGSIVNIASHFAFKAAPDWGSYCVAKAGVVMLTRVLARELGSYNIRANALGPGLTKTEANRPRWTNLEYLKQREAAIPLGRAADPYDMVGTALFLASDASSYITGQTILVEGGVSA